MGSRDLRELSIDTGDLRLERSDFVDHRRQDIAKHLGQFGVGVLEDGGHASEHRPSANRYGVAVFT